MGNASSRENSSSPTRGPVGPVSAEDGSAGDAETGGQESGGVPAAATGPDTGEGKDAGQPGESGQPPERARRRRSLLRELPVLIVIAVALALVIRTYLVQPFSIPSGSMQDTLQIGDRVLVNKLVYHLRGIHRGDIVVFSGAGSWDPSAPQPGPDPFVRFFYALESVVGINHDSDIYIKRVIGLPGDHVACCDAAGRITVDGVPLSEASYLYPGNTPSTQRFNITVPPGRLWVMGDHRLVSYDSRGHIGDPGGGTIPESAVIGRAFVIIWPPGRWTILNIPATFDQPRLNAPATGASGSTAAGTPAGSAAVLAAALRGGSAGVAPAWPALPLAGGLAGAVPLTWLERRTRRRLSRRRARKPVPNA